MLDIISGTPRYTLTHIVSETIHKHRVDDAVCFIIGVSAEDVG